MRFTSLLGMAMAAASVSASPTKLVNYVRHEGLPADPKTRDLMEFARSLPLEKRISEDFDLTSDRKDDTLFNGNFNSKSANGVAQSVNLNVVCKDCTTKGTITAELTTRDLIKPVVRFDLKGVEASMDLSVATSGTLSFAINLFTSETPFGLSLPGIKLGLIFSVDLVFSLSDKVTLEGGFNMKLPDDAFFQLDVLDGDISDKLVDGSGFNVIPITVDAGALTFKAVLRVRADLAAAVEFGVAGGGVSAGVFANLVEFVANVDKTDTCKLEAKEFFDLNVGAQASAGIGAGVKTFNVVPGVSTTLITSPTFTQCLIENDPVVTTEVQTTAAAAVTSAAEAATSAVAQNPAVLTTLSTVTATSLPPYVVSSVPLANGTATLAPPGNATASVALPTNGTAIQSQSQHFSGTASQPTQISSAGEGCATPSPTPTKAMYRRQDEGKVYVITDCAVDVVNCPTDQASILTVTDGGDLQIAALASAPEPTLGIARLDAMESWMVLAEMATPVVNSYVPPPTATA